MEEEIIGYFNKQLKLKKYEIDLLEYMEKDEFKKCALYIIGA
jgi:hypothetical protein